MLSVPLGLAVLPISEHLLMLLCQGLPFLSVLPAAIQQGQTVFGYVGQGLRKRKETTKREASATGLLPGPHSFPEQRHGWRSHKS